MAYKEELWMEAKKKCRLGNEEIRMAKEMGLNPKSLIKNIPNKNEQWKAPVKVWIRDMYEERQEKAAKKAAKKAKAECVNATVRLMDEMIAYDKKDPKRIQHFIKVHSLAKTIAVLESMSEEELHILEAAAILHDIGIHKAEEVYHSISGKHQEELGPAEAEKLLRKNGGYTDKQIERIEYLIGHHHTYTEIDGLDHQILVEADFLVNLYEDECDLKAVEAARKRIFKTEAGLRILDHMF